MVYPAYMNTLDHIRSETLRSFKTQFNLQKPSMSEFETYKICRGSSIVEQFNQQCSGAP